VCASGSFPTGVPRERGRAEKPADLDGVALGDGEGAPGSDTLENRHVSSIVPLTGMQHLG
jgi:hypothetical protein